ncbi:hypothetical protein CV014_20050 [Nostoc sp. CMAA1605]|nr:hypothetical protein [Nostoc sp. CMAA1605]
MGIGHWALGIEIKSPSSPQSPVPSPQSPVPSPQSPVPSPQSPQGLYNHNGKPLVDISNSSQSTPAPSLEET